MLKLRAATAAMLLTALASPAHAAPKMVVHPVQLANESIRYNHGMATIDQFSSGGSVQVRPAPMDHGSLAFNVAVFNTGNQPLNIDVANFTLTSGAVTVTAQTAERLQQKATNRAAWAQFAVALAGGLTAVAAANQRDTYRSTFVTPRGTYRSTFSAPSAYGQLQSAAAIAGAGVGVAEIQGRLDQTLEALGTQIVQITTVDPGESYAGTIVFEKVKLGKLPQQVTMVVDWAGQKYPFTFQLAKSGTPAPPFNPAPMVVQQEAVPPAALPQPSAPQMAPAILVIPAQPSPMPATAPLTANSAAALPVNVSSVAAPQPVAVQPPVAPRVEKVEYPEMPPPGCTVLLPSTCVRPSAKK